MKPKERRKKHEKDAGEKKVDGGQLMRGEV